MKLSRDAGTFVFGVLIRCVLLGLVLQACSESSIDKDGIPIVDLHGTIVAPSETSAKASRDLGVSLHGTRVVLVGNQKMTLDEFVRKYCLGKDLNTTCSKAKTINAMDASRGPVVNLPGYL